MGDVYYAFDRKPLSHNKGGVAAYKTALTRDFNANFAHLYTGIPFPIDHTLQTDILYIDGVIRDCNRMDIDNLSKPLVDSFSGTIYIDDKQVVRRVATRYRNLSYDITELDFSDLPFEVFHVVSNAFDKGKEHITIFKVSEINLQSFGGKFLWE